MMKLLRTRSRQVIALLLALLLVLTNMSTAVAVRPASSSGTVLTAGEAVATHYNLSAEEKALLSSGLLAGERFTYSVPSDSSLVTVNVDARSIRARNYTDQGNNVWTAVSAAIIVNGAIHEEVTLDSGIGNYSYTGKAFSVQVNYELCLTVSADVQSDLLNTPYWLQQGVRNLRAFSEASGSLSALEYGMPELYNLAVNGYKIGNMTAGFSSDGKTAVFALKSQMDKNGGKLNLSTMLDAYSASNEVEYLLKNGAAFKAEAETTMGYVTTINTALGTVRGVMGGLVSSGMVDKSLYDMVITMNDMLNKLESAAGAALSGDWTAAEKGTALVKSGMTANDYNALEALCSALGSKLHTAADFTIANPLVAATAVVQSNMSMKDVTVVVKLMVTEDAIGSTRLISGGADHSAVLTMEEGADMDAVRRGVESSGVLEEAQAGWSAWVEGQFVPSVSVSPSVSKLTTDITYTVTYSPVEYTITYGEGFGGKAPRTVPYGYQLQLERNPDYTKVYDYLVNGTYFAQNSVITVSENLTLSRTSGKPYTNTDLFRVIAGNYAGNKESAILTSGALLGNQEIAVRYPDSDSGELVTIAGDLITALPYESDYDGLIWMPYCYIIGEDTYYFNGSQEAIVEEVAYDSIQVIYRLSFRFGSKLIVEKLNLPAMLVEEAESQKSTLDRLSADGVYSNLQSLDKGTMGALKGVISVTDFNENGNSDDDGEMQAYFEAIVTDMIQNCFDSNGKLKIYNALTGYRAKEGGGLAYYYANSEAFLREVDLIAGYLSEMLADDEKVHALQVMVRGAGKAEYADKIVDLEGIMAEVRDDLAAPNAAIDTASPNLEKLVAALTMSGTVNTYTAAQVSDGLWLDSDPFLLAASNKAAVKITLVLGEQTRVVSATYDKGYTLTQADVNSLLAQVDAAINEVLGGKLAYYTNNYEDGKAVKALVGTRLTQNYLLSFGWIPNEYVVKIVDESGREVAAEQILTADNLSISLPVASEPGVRYDYTIDGKNVSAARYTFTLEQLGRLFTAGKPYRIVQKTVNVAGENLETLVANLNQLVGAGSFVLTKENGRYTKLTATMGLDGIMGMAMGMINSGYDYVGLNYETLIALTSDGALEISLQSVINAALHDNSFTNHTLINLAAKRSGKLVTTTMQLGSAPDAVEQDLIFELNLSSVPNRLVSLGNALASGRDQFAFQANNGQLEMTLTLTEEEYTAYLGNLILTGNAELTDLNGVRMLTAYQFLETYIDALLADDVTTKTLENTAAGMGQELNLAARSEYFRHMKNILGGDKLVSTASGYKLNAAITAEVLDDVMAAAISDPAMLSNIRSLVKECKTGSGLSVNARLAVTNFKDTNKDGLMDTGYQAAILDNGAAGASIITFTTNLAAAAGSLSGSSIVVLQSDVKGSLNFSHDVLINLNGYTVDGNITAKGRLVILDSTFGVEARGGVTGSVTGSDVLILSGTFGADISRYLPNGAVRDAESGAVMNQIYTITEDAAGNLTVNVKAGMLNLGVPADRTYISTDLYTTFLFRHFSAALLKMDEETLCLADLENLYELKGSSNPVGKLMEMYKRDAIGSWFSDLHSTLMDFVAVEEAILSGAPIYEGTMATAPWQLTLTHDLQKDVLVMGASPSPEVKMVSITVKVVGSQEDKSALAALNGGLAQTTEGDINYDVKGMKLVGSFMMPNYSVAKTIRVDLSKNNDYAAVVGVLLAASGVNRTELVAGLKSWFGSHNADSLNQALAKVTFDQFMTAIFSVKKDVTFAAMVSELGVSAGAGVVALEGVYHNFLANLAQQDRTRITDGQTLGEDGIFEIKKTVTPAAKSGSMILPGEQEAPYTVDLTISVFGTCVHSYGRWTNQDDNHHNRTCSRCGAMELAAHVYDDASDTSCNDCGHKRSGGGEDPDPEIPGFDPIPGSAVYVRTAQQLASAIRGGGVIVVDGSIRMDRDIHLTKSVTIHGADKISADGYLFFLDGANVTLTSDRKLNVASGVDGCFAIRDTSTGKYALTDAPAPVTGEPVAGSKVEKLKGVRYLFLDVDPSNGMSLSALSQLMSYDVLKGTSLKLAISGNSGSGLVKTSDRLTVTVWNEDARQTAQVTYVVIVMGDTNCNGKVNTSDATILRNINLGETYSIEIQLAADTNLSGTPETPKINSSDVTYIMSKWFAWDNGKYVSNLK